MSDPGYSETVRVEDLKPYDIFQGDSSVILHLVNDPSAQTVYVETVCHGIGKEHTFNYGETVRLWRRS